MKNVFKTFAKSVLILLGLTAASSETGGANRKKNGSGMTKLITSNEEMDDIMKAIKSLEKSGLLIKNVSKTIQNEAKEKNVDFSECY